MRRIPVYFFLLSTAVLAQKGGTPQHRFSYAEPLTQPSGADAAGIAWDYLKSIAPSLHLTSENLDSVYVARQYKSDHNGVSHFLFRQRFDGIEVRNAAWTVNIDREGRVINAGGTLYASPANGITAASVSGAIAAVRTASAAVNPKLAERYVPITTGVNGKRLKFTKGQFAEEIIGEPVWFGVAGNLQPAWSFTIVDENGIDSYAVVVETITGRIVAKTALTFYQQAAPKGLVYEKGSPQPIIPAGVAATATPPIVPRTLRPFTGDPVASPRGWVDGIETAGNNVTAGTNPFGSLCITGIDTCFIRPITVSSAAKDFSFPLEVGPSAAAPTQFSDAAVVNLFYWNNRAHDLLYQAGFDEAAGNFQTDNFGRGGIGNDSVYAYAQSGILAATRATLNNADFGGFRPGEDGARPRMRMFVWTLGGFFTDSSLDADVIVHEYGHGVTFRLVPDFYTTFQGGAMGEAWSDFFALELVSPEGLPANGVYPAAGYTAQSFATGDRSRPYSADFTVNPLTFAQLGHVISQPEVHADGEIWAQALVEVREALMKQFGETEGRRRMRRIAIDSLKLSPPAPSMLDARDAILLADRTTFAGASQQQIWAAFARRGFGILAQSFNANSVHVTPSTDTPSNKASLRFYEDRYTIGETVRIVLQDANLTTPIAGIQVTSSSGDLENVALKRDGAVYRGEILTRFAPAFRGDGNLTLVPGDSVTAYYVDADSGNGPKLVEHTVPSVPDYALQLAAPRLPQMPGETALGLKTAFGSALRALPFEFPFYGKKYSSAFIYSNGIITFDSPDFSPCSDVTSLRLLKAIAPMWMNLVTNGFAQQNEDVFVSETADSVTYRWAAETAADVASPGLTAAPQPVNFSATLFRNGNIEFRYGTGNRALVSGSQLAGCPVAGATVGISSGHESLVQLVSTHDSQSSLEAAPAVIFQSPYSPIGGPQIVLNSPAAGDTFSTLLSGSGVVYDSEPNVFIRRVDVLIDGVARSAATLGISRPDFCQGKDILGCPNVGFTFSLSPAFQGINAGPHTFQLRALNSRGVVLAYPDQPLSFTVDPGAAQAGVFAKIETPLDGAKVSGRVPITGYFALADARVAGVDILIDGITYGAATYGAVRNDVCSGLTGTVPDCPRIGFTFTLVTTAQNPTGDIFLAAGVHTLQVRGRDAAGRLFVFPEKPVSLNVDNPKNEAPLVFLTVPSRNETVTGKMSIVGYAYDPDGRVVTVRPVVDGVQYNSIPVNYGSARPEACAALPNVPACPAIGFELEFDTRRLANGPHTLRMVATDDLGALGYAPPGFFGSLNFFVNNP